MIEVTKCPAGHNVWFDRPFWKRASPLRAKAVAECQLCKTSAHWRELDERIANSRKRDAEERQRDLARRQEEASTQAYWPTEDMSWARRLPQAPLHSGGGGVFDGANASGRWGLVEPPAANDLSSSAPAPYESPACAPAPSYDSSSSDSGSCSSSSD